jgi:uncharacterized protein
MHNKVVYRASQALNNAERTTRRSNFRGVGQSTGTFAETIGEKDDARLALNYLQQQTEPLPLVITGFSFGSHIGLQVGLDDERVKAVIVLGIPLKMYDFDYIKACRKPILFVHGERDEFGDSHDVLELASKLSSQTVVRAEIIEGADHFFVGKLDLMMNAIEKWIDELWKQ